MLNMKKDSFVYILRWQLLYYSLVCDIIRCVDYIAIYLHTCIGYIAIPTYIHSLCWNGASTSFTVKAGTLNSAFYYSIVCAAL